MYTAPAALAPTAAMLRSGQRDLSKYVDQMCDRLERIDPSVQAMLPESARRERLHSEAAALPARFPDPAGRPPLYGVLVAVKDIFHVDGFVTRCGSALPPHLFAGPEAASVRLLRQAGALILGKSITTEFAYYEPGPTRNPHNLQHTPGGSSSGSAAAVAAGLCPLAVGTQTIGSVIRPAAFCGIVGFKPSFGRIPREGLVIFSRTVDHVGLFTQDVAGMALAAGALCQGWRTLPAAGKAPVLGVPEGAYLQKAEPAALQAFREQVERLQAGGFDVRPVPALAEVESLNQRHFQLVAAEFAQEHAAFYAEHAALYRPRTAWIIEQGQAVSPAALAEARASTTSLRAGLATLMAEAGIDLWLCPAAPGPAPHGIDSTGDPIMNMPWTHAGMPAITLPAGKTAAGLPLGLQMVAPFGADEALLRWAEQIEGLLAQ